MKTPVSPTYPGVYIEEIPSSVRTITGVSTSVTAFVGRTKKGPTDGPVLIHSFAEFERKFGGLWKYSSLGYACYQYFENGGRDALILRIFNPKENSTIQQAISYIDVDNLKILAPDPGSWWSKNLAVRITHPISSENKELFDAEAAIYPTSPPNVETLFNLDVLEINNSNETILESFYNLSTKGNSPRFVNNVFKRHSNIFGTTSLDPSSDNIIPTPKANDPSVPAKKYYKLSPDSMKDDGDNITEDELEKCLPLLDKADIFNLMVIPPLDPLGDPDPSHFGKFKKALSYLEQKEKRAMLIVDAPKDWKIDNVTEEIKKSAFVDLRNKKTAIFFPHVVAPDPLNQNAPREFVPSPLIAGIIARTDVERGVWKAPAGMEAAFRGINDLTVHMTDQKNGELNPRGINCLRIKPPYGIVVWGARTMRGHDQLSDQWKYIPVRRLADYIEESLYRGTQWVIFEPNDEPLWAQVRLNVGAFMHDLFIKGAFQGTTSKQAYLVKCDHETTTQQDIDKGIINIIVGFAPLKPAEFVILKITQLAGQTAGAGA